MEAILENIVRSPKFPRYVDELVEFRHQEAAARARFRAALDEEVREEFINGEVVKQMPAKHRHTLAVRHIGGLADVFVRLRKLGAIATEQALTEFPRNDYGPDICFWGPGKSSQINDSTLIYPIPDFICEVLSPSTEDRDRGVKFEDYAAHGVAEYWIVDPELRLIEQYFARDGKFELAGKFIDGLIRARAIEGFEMPVAAAFDEGRTSRR
jgi:Uma2 family endonuclease